MSIMMYMLRNMKNSPYSAYCVTLNEAWVRESSSEKKASPRLEEFRKKLREKTPINSLEEPLGKHPYEEKEPLQPWPNNTNPNTGEIGGPRGPEPTRYGDWERKGRVSDF